MKLGDWQWHSLETGRFRLDGGAMFGNVPKVLWEKKCPADEHNRIEMALRCLLLKRDDRIILVDTGMGHKWSDKQLNMYHLDYSQFTLEKSLADISLTPHDITDVILTHLHFDHAGGATKRDGERLVATFPQATYHLQQDNLNTATKPNVREKASYLSENWDVLIETNQLKIHKGSGEILPGVWAQVSHGHTHGMQVLTVKGDGRTLSYCADMIPMSTHVTPVYTMGYDVEPVRLIDEKNDFYKNIVADNGILFFEHDAQIAACTLTRDERGRPCAGETILKAP